MDEGEVGYLGHLRDIANEMITVAGYSPIIADLMEGKKNIKTILF